MSSQKKPVLIIEDSLAVATLLHEFLKKLGYNDVSICDKGRSGIQTFEDHVKAGKMPVILLDYNLPDMNGDDIMFEIFRIRPDAKIIIETASERTDESIKSVLRSGAYEYLEKPIRFENLKNTMTILEEEEKILENKESAEIPKSGTKMDSLLGSSSQISLARISEYCGITKEDALIHLKQLESEGKIQKISDIKEISCNRCSSIKIGTTFQCPSCNSSNFKQGTLIEHYKCGNISLDDTYKDNLCPKCRKEIKILGVDYKILKSYYVCNDCGNKFPDPATEFLCLKCDSKFKMEDAKWITSEGYKSVSL
jgi:response regulator of citrate/malate metabolism